MSGQPQYSYSTDEETYHTLHDTPEEAAAAGFDSNSEAETVWVGEALPRTAHRYVCVDQLIEQMQESAWERVGESAEGWLCDFPHEKSEALTKLIGDFIQDHEPPAFWVIDVVRQFWRTDVGMPALGGDA